MIKVREERPDTVFLRGNHDNAMLQVRDILDPDYETDLSFDDVSWWFSYGGRETMASYGGGTRWYERVPEAHWEFLESTALEYRLDGYIFVHAGLLPPGEHWFEGDDPRMWVRERFLNYGGDFGGVVVYGHTPTPGNVPKVEKTRIGIDTGVAKGGPLTAALLEPFAPETARFISAA